MGRKVAASFRADGAGGGLVSQSASFIDFSVRGVPRAAERGPRREGRRVSIIVLVSFHARATPARQGVVIEINETISLRNTLGQKEKQWTPEEPFGKEP